ncbi:hypothetical protein [Pseudonocardia zijingensis]|jgi:hypothetical protein
MALGGTILASPAFADEEHAFTLEIQEPDPVAPGTEGLITYELTNGGDEATDGVLVNVSLPPDVVLNFDVTRCQKTGTNEEGGDLVSCNFSDEFGKFAPGESKTSQASYTVAADAPESTSLGEVGALAVPLEKGEPTEDWSDLSGSHVDTAEITTGAGSAGTWDQLRGFFGL